MRAAEVVALTDRAYARIGICKCPPAAQLCENCEVLRDLIMALAHAYPDVLTDPVDHRRLS